MQACVIGKKRKKEKQNGMNTDRPMSVCGVRFIQCCRTTVCVNCVRSAVYTKQRNFKTRPNVNANSFWFLYENWMDEKNAENEVN